MRLSNTQVCSHLTLKVSFAILFLSTTTVKLKEIEATFSGTALALCAPCVRLKLSFDVRFNFMLS